MWTAENIPSPAHPHPHPLPAACSFGDHFAAAAVSLSPSNLIGKPQACHSVPAAHIWTNALGENDTNLSVRWQRNDERGREALARGNNIQCSRRHLSWCSSQRCRNRINAYKWYRRVASGKSSTVQQHLESSDTWRGQTICETANGDLNCDYFSYI